MRTALAMYADGLTSGHNSRLTLRLKDGTTAPLALTRWLGPATETDEALLGSVRGPVLDVGCGPGRHLHALARRGVFALGVDLSPVAVGLARDGGANAIVGSIFDEVPGTGTWRTALLLDGNIGIGGRPKRLLRRVAALLRADGEVLVELDHRHANTGSMKVRLESAREVSAWFRWARVAPDDIEAVAASAGFEVRDRWGRDDRRFARLHKRYADSGCS
jgi:SAM-dependent methyltransferase